MKRAVRAEPTWSDPVGAGEKRTRMGAVISSLCRIGPADGVAIGDVRWPSTGMALRWTVGLMPQRDPVALRL